MFKTAIATTSEKKKNNNFLHSIVAALITLKKQKKILFANFIYYEKWKEKERKKRNGIKMIWLHSAANEIIFIWANKVITKKKTFLFFVFFFYIIHYLVCNSNGNTVLLSPASSCHNFSQQKCWKWFIFAWMNFLSKSLIVGCQIAKKSNRCHQICNG